MKFTYKPLEVKSSNLNKNEVVFRPIIPVYLFGNNKVIGYEAIIDSGADFNIFHSEIADILGINYKSGTKRMLFGLGKQSINGYECKMEIKIQGFDKYQTSVIFSGQIPPNSFGVLGNKGFFDKHNVNFKYKQKIIEVGSSLFVLN